MKGEVENRGSVDEGSRGERTTTTSLRWRQLVSPSLQAPVGTKDREGQVRVTAVVS